MAIDPSMLDAVPLFAGIAEPSRGRLASAAELVHARGGSVLFEEGEPAEDVYFLLEGRVALSLRLPGRSAMTVLSLRPGDLTGWSGILGGPRVATARAVEDARLLRISGRDLAEICEKDHELGYRVMCKLAAELARRLHDARLQLLDVYGEPGA